MKKEGRKGPPRLPGEENPGCCDQGKRVLVAGGPRRRILDNLRSTPLLPGMSSAASPRGDQMTNEADFCTPRLFIPCRDLGNVCKLAPKCFSGHAPHAMCTL